MSILAWIVFGLVVGLLARAIMPGPQPMGLIRTTLLGIAGSFAGGIVAEALATGRIHFGGYYPIHSAGLIGSVLGALLLMIIASVLRGR
jgi:uncharacterized membrane protein YeaQ/YmgE (transglycosylase-associated protein family)